MALAPRLLELLRSSGMGNIPVVIGGIIPAEDVPHLKEMGVSAVFGPGASMAEIVKTVRELVSVGE